MNTKIIATVAVAIIVVAGIGAYILIGNNDDSEPFKNYGGRLMVFGNANNDDYIDNDDLETVKQIINDGWDKEKNPYADANNDGDVNEKDIEYIEKMIKREPMTLTYINVNGDKKTIDYPIKNIVVIGSDSMRAMQILGLKDNVVGRNGSSSPDKYLDPTLNKTIYQNATELSKSTSKIDIGLLTELMDKTDVDAIVTTATAFKDTESQVEELGPKVVRMSFGDEKVGINSFLTFGYLANAESKAKDVTGFLDGVQRNIDTKLSTLSDEQRVKIVSMAGGGALYANTTTTSYGS